MFACDNVDMSYARNKRLRHLRKSAAPDFWEVLHRCAAQAGLRIESIHVLEGVNPKDMELSPSPDTEELETSMCSESPMDTGHHFSFSEKPAAANTVDTKGNPPQAARQGGVPTNLIVDKFG